MMPRKSIFSRNADSQRMNTGLSCRWGNLVDVNDRRNGTVQTRRHLYCLRGVVDPDICTIKVLEKIGNEKESVEIN